MSPPRVVATFDLTSTVERKVRDIIERFHRGRWPLFRCNAMRRVGNVVYEVAEWTPTRTGQRPPVLLSVEWNMKEIAMRWQDFPTLAAAREAFAAIVTAASPALMEGSAA